MEIPEEILNLYTHWDFHTKDHKNLNQTEVFKDSHLYTDISTFINERMSIWNKKRSNAKPPYTNDEILRTYRFCNVLRELDRQTIEFHILLKPLENDFSLWLLNMFYCRMVARTKTIQDIGFISFNTKHNKNIYEKLLAYPKPKYGTPYVFPVSLIMRSNTPTRESFITQYAPTVLKDVAKEIQSWNKISVAEGLNKVIPIFGFNFRFLWTEVLIDTAYQFPEHIDLFKEFPIGPGALPTFKKINNDIQPEKLAKKLGDLQHTSGLTLKGKEIVLSAENWEGIGCEYRKYMNLKSGKGRKRLFTH